MYHKEVVYDRETKDYALYLDAELVGFARTYHEGEVTLDQLVFELITDGYTATATQLDGGAPDVLAELEPGGIDSEPIEPPPTRAPSLSQAIAIGLVGTPDPLCSLCGAPAFVWCDGQMFCQDWWQQGQCTNPTPPALDGPNPGRAIAKHWHSRPKSFIAVLRSLDPVCWWPLAEAYSAWRGCSVQQTLDTWLLAVQGTHVPANAQAA